MTRPLEGTDRQIPSDTTPLKKGVLRATLPNGRDIKFSNGKEEDAGLLNKLTSETGGLVPMDDETATRLGRILRPFKYNLTGTEIEPGKPKSYKLDPIPDEETQHRASLPEIGRKEVKAQVTILTPEKPSVVTPPTPQREQPTSTSSQRGYSIIEICREADLPPSVEVQKAIQQLISRSNLLNPISDERGQLKVSEKDLPEIVRVLKIANRILPGTSSQIREPARKPFEKRPTSTAPLTDITATDQKQVVPEWAKPKYDHTIVVNDEKTYFLIDGKSVGLGNKQEDVLRFLVERAGRRLTNAELYQLKMSFGMDSKTFNRFLSSVGKKLGDDPANPSILVPTIDKDGESFEFRANIEIQGRLPSMPNSEKKPIPTSPDLITKVVEEHTRALSEDELLWRAVSSHTLTIHREQEANKGKPKSQIVLEELHEKYNTLVENTPIPENTANEKEHQRIRAQLLDSLKIFSRNLQDNTSTSILSFLSTERINELNNEASSFIKSALPDSYKGTHSLAVGKEHSAPFTEFDAAQFLLHMAIPIIEESWKVELIQPFMQGNFGRRAQMCEHFRARGIKLPSVIRVLFDHFKIPVPDEYRDDQIENERRLFLKPFNNDNKGTRHRQPSHKNLHL